MINAFASFPFDAKKTIFPHITNLWRNEALNPFGYLAFPANIYINPRYQHYIQNIGFLNFIIFYLRRIQLSFGIAQSTKVDWLPFGANVHSDGNDCHDLVGLILDRSNCGSGQSQSQLHYVVDAVHNGKCSAVGSEVV